MRRRVRDDSVSIQDVLAEVRKLHGYRAKMGYAGHLDERVGKLDSNERVVADVLISEGCNVTFLLPKKSGRPTADFAVDGVLAEVKTSIGASTGAFSDRLVDAAVLQSRRLLINAVNSRITQSEMAALVRRLVDDGVLSYARVVGAGYDIELGRWYL